MADTSRLLLEALDEPALIVSGTVISATNAAARALLGSAIEGADVRLAIRHPQALDHILAGRHADAEIAGIGEFDRPWTLAVRKVGARALLVRLVDRSAAVAAEKMRVDFVANASHELRTPLSTILGYAETLEEDAELEPPLRTKFGGVIRSEAKRMLRIIEDLMSLSRIEAGRFAAARDIVEIAEVVADAVGNARGIADDRKCEIGLDIEKGLPPVPGDRSQLVQLLDNLLTNAMRYGPTDKACMVRVSAKREGEWVSLVVEDNGKGIAREHLPRVTERFYRVDAARSRDSGGTGLGLAIVKHIVERHRGSLHIRSEIDQGTSVEVRLPIPR